MNATFEVKGERSHRLRPWALAALLVGLVTVEVDAVVKVAVRLAVAVGLVAAVPVATRAAATRHRVRPVCTDPRTTFVRKEWSR